MCSKGREEVRNPPTLVNLINDDFGIVFELSFCVINMKKKVCGVLESFLSFLFKHEEKILHNMLCLMLERIFNNLHFVFSFICREEGVSIVEEYNKQSLYPMF
jgi:hypothetical protein